MFKEVKIIFLAAMISGCSATRHGKTNLSELPVSDNQERLLELIKRNNITENDFYIKKAEVEVTTNVEKLRFIATLKYKRPGNYLISVKSLTGIEITRIFLKKDSIFVNERINKKFYKGSFEYLNKRYGISQTALPVLLGDFIADFFLKKRNEISDNTLGGYIDGTVIKYDFNNKINKIIRAKSVTDSGEERICLKFLKFKNNNNIVYPQEIDMQDYREAVNVMIRIRKMQIPFEGNLEFIAGKSYEIIELK